MIPIDMVPLYMMIGGSLAMLVFTIAYKKRGGEYDAPPARFALLAYYGVVIASVTVFMVSCNFHRVGLSISMCYLFAIMIAPTYRRVDTVAVCVLILISWWLPGQLPTRRTMICSKHFPAAIFHHCRFYRAAVHLPSAVCQRTAHQGWVTLSSSWPTTT